MTTRVLRAGKTAAPLPARRRGMHLRRMAPARGGNGADGAGGNGITSRAWWPWVKRALTAVFFVLVGYMLYRFASTVKWPEVAAAIRAYPWPVLGAACVLAAGSHLLYSTYDLLGRHYTGHKLATTTVMKVTFISYAFNLNLGSLVGGIAFRYRLYSKLGLDNGQVTRIVTLSMLTNWLGYFLLAGAMFTFWPLEMPPQWKMDSGSLPFLGIGMLAVVAAYLVMCGVSSRRQWTIRGHELNLPSLRVAALQLGMSCANWLLISGIVYVLMPDQVGFTDVLTVLLIAAVAGVITHVPAGLGVLEAVFVALLAHQAPSSQLLAALLTYRAVYYIAPFAIALVAYLATEARRR
ncbi:MAG: lysylphosphatidylglycerol synthase domain-containing protein [Pseudomonadota bacterium]